MGKNVHIAIFVDCNTNKYSDSSDILWDRLKGLLVIIYHHSHGKDDPDFDKVQKGNFKGWNISGPSCCIYTILLYGSLQKLH